MFNDHRYSRQSYTIGQDAQVRISNAIILVIGYNSVAQEIIRNLALIGISKIDVFNKDLSDSQKTESYSINEYIPIDKLSELNSTIEIKIINNIELKKYNCIILTNSTIEEAIKLNKETHQLSIPFIMCGCYGLMGYIFNDFGNEFIINDIDGEISESLIINSIDNKILKFKDQHKLSDGDIISVLLDDDSELEYKVFKKRSPTIVELFDIPLQDKNRYKKILRKKKSEIFEFQSLEENLNKIKFSISDWSVPVNRTDILHKFHISINKYFKDYQSYPNSWCSDDYNIFKNYLDLESNKDFLLAKKFSYTAKGNLIPIVSIIGGIVSHEILKVITHKYIPILQWYYFDYLDLITDKEIFDNLNNQNFTSNTKYKEIINIFGKDFLNKLQNTIPFVIGSGAIGCELLKNLSILGIKQIYLTDPDHIEKSNLSRQFLFNDSDIRESKSIIAARKVELMNSDIKVNVYNKKICAETENIFDINFHSKIDIYLNALDNINARLYMDSQAIKYSKPLIDSGTLGSKGNIQVIIPHLTESYASTTDPDDKIDIPICTIKAFPYKSEHTIQWARELFENEFNQIPNLLNKFKNKSEFEKINDNETKNLIKQIYKYKDFTLSENAYLKLLFIIYNENHIDCISDIINKYSQLEYKEELNDNKLPIYLDDNNLDIDFFNSYLNYGFELLNQVFQTNIKLDIKNILLLKKKLINLDIKLDLHKFNNEEIIEILFTIITTVPFAKPIEFEKDNDELCHISWINCSSNMRNIQYSIPQIKLSETRRIAGNIIPALITTTSLIAGFQILEFIKICKFYNKNDNINEKYFKTIDIYKNRFVNLNINYCDGITPGEIKKYTLINNEIITIWTNLIISSLYTNEIINQIELKTHKKIEFITNNDITIFDGEKILLDKIDISNNLNIEILLEDIPFGIPITINIPNI